MNANDESALLLQEFAKSRSETAFVTLLGRHLNLVYSAAFRRCGGQTGLTEEVCQKVFIDFARKAHALPIDRPVAGWLYQHACFVASATLRAEVRRQRREKVAVQLQSLTEETNWSDMAPVLDEAMLDLSAADRDSLAQRFFEKRPYAEIGERLGSSENAARMRVSRSLDKLRAALEKRGVTSTASALGIAMAGPAIIAAPTGWASTITSLVMVNTVKTTSTFGLISIMTSTKFKIGFLAAVLTATGTVLVLHQIGNRLRAADNAVLKHQVAELTEEALAARETAARTTEELERLRRPTEELLRLRGEVAKLRGTQTQPALVKVVSNSGLFSTGEKATASGPLADMGTDTPENASISLLWAVTTGQMYRFVELVKLADDISEADASKVNDQLFRQMTNAYAHWQFGSVKRTENRDDGTQKLYFEYTDIDTGRVGELLVCLRKYESAWKVVIDDVP